jgi:hypothetical protein
MDGEAQFILVFGAIALAMSSWFIWYVTRPEKPEK